MTTITVKDASGTNQTVAKVLDTGQAAMAASLPVVLASNQSAIPVSGPLTDDELRATSVPVADAAANTKLDSVIAGLVTLAGYQDGVEGALASILAKIIAAPATESKQDTIITALSTLAGYEDGIEALLAAISGKLPASLGIKTAASSISVAPASDAVFTVSFGGVAPSDISSGSGGLTLGGTAQNAAASNAARKGFWLQNLSAGDLWISTIGTAALDRPSLKLGPGAYYESPPGGAGTGAISIVGATTGQKWSGREW